MLESVFALAVTIFVAACVLKGFKAQVILMCGGMAMMAVALLTGGHPAVPPSASTGSQWLDIIQYIKNTLSVQSGGLGLKIMAIAGFAAYLSHIGASETLVGTLTKPLKAVRHHPYVFLAICFLIGEFLSIFITSASGLGILLMVTIYPLLRGIGLSQASSAAPIATAVALEIGPSQGNPNLAAEILNMDVVTYVVDYQMTVAVFGLVTIALLHIVCQRWYDTKMGYFPKDHLHLNDPALDEKTNEQTNKEQAPTIYAILPVIPLVLIFTFSKLLISSISMNVVTAMLISVFIAMIFELVRYGKAKEVADSIQVFFDGMGRQFANVVTFIVAGQTFAQGLKTIGAIEMIINSAQAFNFGATAIILVMVGIIIVSSVLMGSGNAAFFSFAGLVPDVARNMGIPAVGMLLPMQLVAGMARNISPIAPNIVAVAGMSEISPFELAKRNTIPIVGGIIVVVLMSLITI